MSSLIGPTSTRNAPVQRLWVLNLFRSPFSHHPYVPFMWLI